MTRVQQLQSTVRHCHPQLMNAFVRGALGPAMKSAIRGLPSCGSNPLDPKEAAASSSAVYTLAVAVRGTMVKGPTNSIFPEDCSAPMGSLRAWFGFTTSKLELVRSFMAVATCFPLIGLPNFNWEVLEGTFGGLTGDAAVGARVFFSGVDGPGVDQFHHEKYKLHR